MIYVHIFTLKSLLTFTLWSNWPFFLPIKFWSGNAAIGTKIPNTPGQPSRIIRIIAIPVNEKGKINDAKNIGIFNSIILKSLESMFTILLVYEFFIVNWDNDDNLENKTVTNPALSLAPIIGAI